MQNPSLAYISFIFINLEILSVYPMMLATSKDIISDSLGNRTTDKFLIFPFETITK